ncbi:MAG: DUF1593 domain-containing protein [Verrucomicrobiota bacterium]
MNLQSVCRLLFCAALALAPAAGNAYQGMPMGKLHVSGRFLQNVAGTNILLHGYMMAGDSWFNGEGHLFSNPNNYASPSSCASMLNGYNGIADILSNPSPLYGSNHGWYCSFVRTAGNGTANGFAPGWDTNGVLSNPAQFQGWITNVMVPWVSHCRSVGLYVVICGGPSQTYPGGDTTRNMTQQFQINLITYWTNMAGYFKNSDNVMFEICNEPINIETSFGANNWAISGNAYFSALTNFMQPIVNAIRNAGDDHILVIPSLGWQGQCQGFANYPIQGTNIAYAGHFYPGYNNIHDSGTAVTNFWNSNYKPCADKYPLIITELAWSPNDGSGYQDLWNGSTAGFGTATRGCFDKQGNVSYLIGMVADLLTNLTSGSLAATTLNPSMQCAPAAFEWFAQYALSAAPAGLYATVVSSNQVNLNWNLSSNAVTYNVKRATVSGGPYSLVASNLTSNYYTDTGLSPSTTYYYVVSAVNGTESGNSAEASASTGSALRFRVVISTDFPPTNVCMPNVGCPSDQTSDPDDVQTMVRWLLYVNEFDVEGMVASSGTFANVANKTNILNILDLYEQVYPNLVLHDARYPLANTLRAVTFQGRTGTWGGTVANNIGAGCDSEASEAIISIVDKPDPRPVWFCFWGDCSNLAQAIWKVQNTRSPAAFQTFLSKIRIHQIAHQDDTIDWLMSNFPNLFIIYSKTTYFGMFGGSDPISDLAWVNANIRTGHGPLGAVYPPSGIGCTGVCEGDTPSWLLLVSALRGLNNPENPTQPSWGGQFSRDGTTSHYVDCCGGSTISMWRPQYQAEFQQRANWMLPASAPQVFTPTAGYAPGYLATRCLQGANAQPLSLVVSNAGTGTLNYTIAAGDSWLSVSPASGSATNGSNGITHAVSFNSSALAPGAYTSSITISAPGATEPSVSVSVALRVLDNSAGTNAGGNLPIISLGFNEGAGTSVTNQGTAGGSLIRTTPVPALSANVPAGAGGADSVDFQTTTGSYYVESPTNYPQLIGLAEFTLCGWVNCRSSTTGSGGNRVVTWINAGGDGVDLVYKSDGSLQLGVDQWPDSSAAVSSTGRITTDAAAGAGNWRFFAVTYDSTVGSGNVRFYFGSPGVPAVLDVTKDYARGLTGTNISRLCIGQFDAASRGYGTDRMFRGLIDEVQVFGQALSIEEIQAVQAGSPPPAPEIHLDALDSQKLLLSWIGSNMTLQETIDAGGPWGSRTNQASAQYVYPTNTQQFFRLQGN